MMKLIALEIKKSNRKSFLLALVYIFTTFLAFTFFASFMPRFDMATSSAPDADVMLFLEWNFFIMLLSTLSLAIFAVFSAVLHAKISVEEYKGKRSILLFGYPQSRRKILFAKCTLVSVFTSISLFVVTVVAISIFAVFATMFDWMTTTFSMDTFYYLVKMSTVSALLASCIGMISLRIGLWKKSMTASIVTAVILIIPFNQVVSLFPDTSFPFLVAGLGIVFIISMIILIETLAKVNRMEAV